MQQVLSMVLDVGRSEYFLPEDSVGKRRIRLPEEEKLTFTSAGKRIFNPISKIYKYLISSLSRHRGISKGKSHSDEFGSGDSNTGNGGIGNDEQEKRSVLFTCPPGFQYVEEVLKAPPGNPGLTKREFLCRTEQARGGPSYKGQHIKEWPAQVEVLGAANNDLGVDFLKDVEREKRITMCYPLLEKDKESFLMSRRGDLEVQDMATRGAFPLACYPVPKSGGGGGSGGLAKSGMQEQVNDSDTVAKVASQKGATGSANVKKGTNIVKPFQKPPLDEDEDEDISDGVDEDEFDSEKFGGNVSNVNSKAAVPLSKKAELLSPTKPTSSLAIDSGGESQSNNIQEKIQDPKPAVIRLQSISESIEEGKRLPESSVSSKPEPPLMSPDASFVRPEPSPEVNPEEFFLQNQQNTAELLKNMANQQNAIASEMKFL